MLVCRAVRQETHDVKTFVFSGRAPRLHSYKPGQFITLDLVIDGQTVNRCYTLSSSPTRPHLISITTKRFAGGIVSPWMHETVTPGVEIRAMGPMGEFNCVDYASPNGKYLLLSAGSGITPLMSMARSFTTRAGGPTRCSCTARAARRISSSGMSWRSLRALRFSGGADLRA